MAGLEPHQQHFLRGKLVKIELAFALRSTAVAEMELMELVAFCAGQGTDPDKLSSSLN
jgi:hypothetical protein